MQSRCTLNTLWADHNGAELVLLGIYAALHFAMFSYTTTSHASDLTTFFLSNSHMLMLRVLYTQ